MKFNKSLVIFSFLFIALLCISSVGASDDAAIDGNVSSLKLEKINENIEVDTQLMAYDNESVLSEPKTIHVEEIEDNHNEMTDPSIQKVIDSANAGDTIIIDGKSYVHCHFVINKKLTIKSTIGTTMSECPGNTKGSGYHGIFYISPEASGTVIEGFEIAFDKNNQVDGENDYGIFVKGASDVTIRNCKVSTYGFSDSIRLENAKNTNLANLTLFNASNGIRIINSENIQIGKSNIKNIKNGINIIDSSQIKVNDNIISNNEISGVSFSGNSKNLTVIYNNITDNFNGIKITSTDHVYILSNYIAFNTYNGVYIDYDVIKIEIKGNFFNQNHFWEVFNDFHTTNLPDNGHEKQIVDNNYMINYGSSGTSDIDRPIWTQVYDYLPGYGEYDYDAANDRYVYVGEMKGDYYGHQGVMFIAHVFEINEFMNCPNIYRSPGKIWSKPADLLLDISEITQVKKGVYSVSIVNANGTVANDLSSVPVTFYLNKADKSANPKEGDVYQTVMMKNGTATVTFAPSLFNETGNVITAVFPTPGTDIDNKVSRTFNVDDGDIPGSSIDAKIISSNVYMIPKLAENYVITLRDISGNPLANQKVTFTVNGKTYNKNTNSKGQAKVLLKFSAQKTYQIKTNFAGTDSYNKVSKTNKIIVKYSSKTAKLTAPTITIAPKALKYYVVTLKDGNGKGIAKQKVTVKINGKNYVRTTNAKGQASVKVKFNSLKNYKVIASYKGSKIYKKASSSGMIKVAKITTKITAPTVSTLPKQSKKYSIVLKTNAGKALSKQKVTIKVNGKNYARTTNAKGIAAVSVKFSNERSYSVVVNYKGNSIYKSSKATGKIVVSRIATQITGNDRTYAKDSIKEYQITLKDKSGIALARQTVKFTVNGKNYSKSTDANGIAKITVSDLGKGKYNIVAKYAGNSKYKAISKTNKITVTNNTNIFYVDDSLSNSEIQYIFDNAENGADIVFLGDTYNGISLNVNKPLNIFSNDKSIVIAKKGSPVFSISANNVTVANFVIKGNSNDGIVIDKSSDISVVNNSFVNNLDESKIKSYLDGTLMLPGYGIHISDSRNVDLSQNTISQFESAIFVEHSSKLRMDTNYLRENNYGIKYGFGVENTQIVNNEISDNIGLYIMTVPEGPSGYGILLNNSAVNVTINKNHISNNHLGISIDANGSTGIVITQNTITDQVLEGIRFNAGYDLALNAVKPLVTDNAIYRNARGPSMMILGELSANPEGIYTTTNRLNLDPNWYGTNNLVTWDNDTGVVGYGTMCPRINTTGIGFNLTYSSGSYEVIFHKNNQIASNLPEFDMYVTLNRGTDKQAEIIFDVIGGIGTFKFPSQNYDVQNNTIEISIGSLIHSTSRVFKSEYTYDVPKSEIPI